MMRQAAAAALLALLAGCSQQAPPEVAAAPTAAPSPSPDPSPVPPSPTAAPTQTPSPTPSPPAPEAPAAPVDPLVARLSRVLDRQRLRATVAVVVLGDGGQVRFSVGGDRPVLPASTQKLVVAAAALARLGKHYRYTTTLTATAAPDANGVINGDLVLVGSGDPTLVSPDFAVVEPDRPHTRLEQLSGLVQLAGVRRVTGRVVGDASAFPDEPVARGWRDRYFTQLDATRVSGLTVNAGRRLLRRGGLTAVAADDPAYEAASELRRLLREQGIRVGAAASTTQPAAGTVELGRVQSPPLGRILRYMVLESDNHLADAVFRSVGAADADGTWAGASAAVQRALVPLGLDWDAVQLADGSGLSRANRIPASFLAALEERMWRSSLRQQWRRLLAVAGRSGTLDSRLTDTVASGRFAGKTGSLRDVRSLVGSLSGPSGAHVAVVLNDLREEATDRARVLIDRVVKIVAEDTYGCRRVEQEPREPRRGKRRKPAKPRFTLVCATLPPA